MPFDGLKRVAPISDAMRQMFDGGKMWTKGELYGSDGSVCFLGAAHRSMNVKGLFGDYLLTILSAFERAGITLPEPSPKVFWGVADPSDQGTLAERRQRMSIATWNDHRERTYADVERVLDALAEIEAEQNVTT